MTAILVGHVTIDGVVARGADERPTPVFRGVTALTPTFAGGATAADDQLVLAKSAPTWIRWTRIRTAITFDFSKIQLNPALTDLL